MKGAGDGEFWLGFRVQFWGGAAATIASATVLGAIAWLWNSRSAVVGTVGRVLSAIAAALGGPVTVPLWVAIAVATPLAVTLAAALALGGVRLVRAVIWRTSTPPVSPATARLMARAVESIAEAAGLLPPAVPVDGNKIVPSDLDMRILKYIGSSGPTYVLEDDLVRVTRELSVKVEHSISRLVTMKLIDPLPYTPGQPRQFKVSNSGRAYLVENHFV